MAPYISRTAKIDALLESALSYYRGTLTGTDAKDIRNNLNFCSYLLEDFPDTTLDKVYHETHVKKTELGRELIELLCESYGHKVLADYLAFRPYLRDSGVIEAQFLTHRIHDYDLLPTVENFIDCDPQIIEQAAAIMVATKRLYHHNMQHPDTEWIPFKWSNGVSISEPSIVQLLIDNPEHADQIAAIMIDRETADANLIKVALNSSSTALSNGVL